MFRTCVQHELKTTPKEREKERGISFVYHHALTIPTSKSNQNEISTKSFDMKQFLKPNNSLNGQFPIREKWKYA